VSTQKKEVCGENAPGLHAQEVPPAWSIAARRGVDAGLLQDRPHWACRNLGAEPGEFVVDPSVTQKEFSRPATGSIGAARCRAVTAGSVAWGLGPASCHPVSVPSQDRGGGEDPMQSAGWGQ
jgi:hypothetical protein